MEDNNLEIEIIPPPPPHSKQLKILTTCAVLLGNITFGCAFNFLAPALENFRVRYGTTVDHISVVFTIMLIAYCVGAVTSGYVYYYVNRQLGAIVCLGAMATALYTTPHCDTSTLFFIVGGIQGFFIGAYDTAQIVWIIEIWKGASGPLIQAQHFCYALGANIPPLLLGPFLSGDVQRNKTTIHEEEDNSHQLTIPFSIGGGFTTVACAFQVFLFIFCRYYVPPAEKLESVQDSDTESLIRSEDDTNIVSINPGDQQSSHHHLKAAGINWKKLQLVILSATFLAAYSSMELNSIQFLPTFARYSALNLSESESAFVLSGLTGSFAAGRGLGIFIIMKYPPQLMLAVSLVFVLVGNSLLLVWGDQYLNLLLVSSIIMGFSYSTVYPSFCAFMEKHLVFSNAVGATMIMTGSMVSASYPLIVGRFIEKNVDIMVYMNFTSLTICSVALALFYRLTYKNKSKVG